MKNNLFRFTITRNFQRISEECKNSCYVEASESIKNQLFFLKGLSQGDTYYEVVSEIKEKEDNFNKKKKVTELRSYRGGIIYEISLILESSFSLSVLINKITEKVRQENRGDLILSEEQEISLWDNLIYFLFIKKSKLDVDAILSLLKSNNFLKRFNPQIDYISGQNSEEKKKLERLLNAKVIIPLDIKTSELTRTNNSSLSSGQKAILLEKHNLIITRYKVEALAQLNEDLQRLKVEKEFNEEFNEDFFQERCFILIETLGKLKKLEKQIEQLKNIPRPSSDERTLLRRTELEHSEVNQQLEEFLILFEQENIDNIEIEYTGNDENTQESIENRTKKILEKKSNYPSSSMSKSTVLFGRDISSKRKTKFTWDKETILRSINDRSKKTLEKKSNYPFGSMDKLKSAINNDINSKLTAAYSNLNLTSTRAYINGMKIDIKVVPIDNSFVISIYPNEDLFDIFLTQYYSTFENSIAEIDGKVIFGENQSDLQLDGKEIAHSLNNYITFKLNEEPFSINDKLQEDAISLRYRLKKDLFRDLEVEIEKIRLIFPHYGVLRVTPGRVLPERSPLYGVTNLGIIDFRRVEQRVVCYEAGEVSHVENIMASEYKEKTSRSFESTEISEESEDITEAEQINDTVSTNRHEMQSEISEVIASENSREFGLGTGLSGESFGVKFSVDTDINLSSSNSKEESNRLAISKAKEITEKVTERILSKVTRKRTYKMLREYEETNKHGFDNRLNNKHVVGIYRWLDKLVENKLINYGTRLTYQFMIGEPARNFKESLVIQSEDSGSESNPYKNIEAFNPPKKPSEILGKEYSNINPHELYKVASLYGVELDKLPDYEKYVSRSFSMVIRESGDEWKTDDAKAFNDEFIIPDNYYCNGFKIRAVAGVHGDDEGDKWAKVIIGDKEIRVLTTTKIDLGGGLGPTIKRLEVAKEEDIPKTEGSLAVSYVTNDIGSLSFNVLARCHRKPEVLDKWKHDAFLAIKQAYEKKLQEYEDKIQRISEMFTEPDMPKNREYNYNTSINRKIERTELKRLCIDMMTQSFDDEFILSDNSYQSDSNSLTLDQDYDIRAKRIEFLEGAFDWDLMAYKFYPYFYAQRNDWHKMMHIDGTNDELFKSFLSSGMAKVKLPVKIGYENAVQFFLRTGEVWFGSGFILDSADDMDISINEEIDGGQEEVEIEETWISRIPTTLTIVQDKGNSLMREGLPCGNEEEILAKGESLLQGVEKNSHNNI